ncbi:phosphatidylglycerophosphatase A [Methylicorpusculum oleiharenae]|uniref:phosphatidylglycerophosphatase A family protein n=1 Tax=Methylicorpusculum oleiharenae TaxID=1338687 RepID=UPI00135C64A6|nr:phosphatidylglycerophosphatase A [Methylicorpusculum oleiharenae]MCD2452182.1 phosphatidylglycerophosphatase A [Methylicorpusculum oleiharenae]
MSIFLHEAGRNKLSRSEILRDPFLFLAFGFGSGLSKKAPGTMGTLAAIPIYWALSALDPWLYGFLVILINLAGIYFCDYAAKKLGEHDFGGIVWDEIGGFLITLLFIPPSWMAVLIGFVLFRWFDIFKPWPISWADKKINGGLGIMLDDIIAGGISCLIMLFIFNDQSVI